MCCAGLIANSRLMEGARNDPSYTQVRDAAWSVRKKLKPSNSKLRLMCAFMFFNSRVQYMDTGSWSWRTVYCCRRAK